MLFDKKTNDSYEIDCKYTGSRFNLYEKGSFQEWIDLYYTYNPDLQEENVHNSVTKEPFKNREIQNSLKYGY